MSDPLAALLIPELRWDPDHGFAHLAAVIADALELGVGGFVLRGGTQRETAALTAELKRGSRHPLLIAAPAERGAGQCILGATGLPPLGALGALRNEDAVRRAARLTARELRALGVNWALAPVLDLAVEQANPFLGARSFGADAQRSAEWGVAWVDACQAEGVLACAMQLPGVGRATTDPALVPTAVDASGALLWSSDLVPFRAAVDSGVATVFVSDVSYEGLDRSRVGAARSRVVLKDLMRDELQYEGLLVSDVSWPSATDAGPEAFDSAKAVGALAAGCDLLLAPNDPHTLLDAVHKALADGVLDPDAVDASLARRAFWADWGSAAGGREATLEDVLWARQVADTVVHAARGVFTNIGPVVDVIPVDDDADRARRGEAARFDPFLATLRAVGLTAREVDGPTDDGRGAVVIAVRGEPAPGRGRVGYTDVTRSRVAEVVARARAARRSVVAVLFGPPAMADELPEVSNIIVAWGGDRAMQEAAARRLA